MKKKLLSLSLTFSVLFSSLSPVWAGPNVESINGGLGHDAPVPINMAGGLPLIPVDAATGFTDELKNDQNVILGGGQAQVELTSLPTGEALSLTNDRVPVSTLAGEANRAKTSSPNLTQENILSQKEITKKGLGKLLAQAALKGSINFDGSAVAPRGIFSIREKQWDKVKLAPGVKLYDSPDSFAGGALSLKRFHLAANAPSADGSQPITLSADPSDIAAVEGALRQLVNSNPSQYGLSDKYGTPDQDMATVHVQRLPKQADQADSIIAVFRQWKKGVDKDGSPYYLLVDGANLRFHIKVLDGKPVIMAVEGGFAPDVDPAIMTSAYTDAQLDQIAQDSLKAPIPPAPEGSSAQKNVRRKAPGGRSNLLASSQKPLFLAREIAYVNKAWRAVNIYQASDLNGNPVMILVDIKTGEPFPVGAEGLRSGVPLSRKMSDGSVSGVISGRGTTLTPDGEDHGPTGPMALPHVKVLDAQGNVLTVADKNGVAVIPASVNGGQPLEVTVPLDGIYGSVVDDDSGDVPTVMKLTVTPGQAVNVTLNPTGDDEQQDANVNAYAYSYQLFDWFLSYLGLSDLRFYTPLAGNIHTNGTSMPGNADYDPSTDGFYLMKRAAVPEQVKGQDGKVHSMSITFENTSQPSISLHELGHRFVQRASQIALTAEQKASPAYRFVQNPMEPVMGSGTNEATADTVSMFMRNNPVLGNGFIINPAPGMPTIIRTGENKTAYDANNSDPHAQGEAQMGTAWMSRKDIVAAMGAVDGALRAAYLFVATSLYAQPGDPVSALTHALLADMASDGSIPHEAIIRGHAKQDHNLDLPSTSAAPSAGGAVAGSPSGPSPAGNTAR